MGWLADFFNSVFVTAILGSLAGAFAGAYGAQRIAERSKRREELLEEIRNTNAAIHVSHGICNIFLSLKKQHTKPMKDDFDTKHDALRKYKSDIDLGNIDPQTVFHVGLDYKGLPIVNFPTKLILKQVFEKLSVIGRPLSLAMAIVETTESFNIAIQKRNNMIEQSKANPRSESQKISLYFGLSYDGKLNTEYPDLIHAIYEQVDNGIMFSKLLCEDLSEHGIETASLFRELSRKDVPEIAKPDFAKAEGEGLMPDRSKYVDWLSMFGERSKRRPPHQGGTARP